MQTSCKKTIIFRTMNGSETNRLCRSLHFLWTHRGSHHQNCLSLLQSRQQNKDYTKPRPVQGMRESLCVCGSVHVCRSGTGSLKPAVSFWRPKIHKDSEKAPNKNTYSRSWWSQKQPSLTTKMFNPELRTLEKTDEHQPLENLHLEGHVRWRIWQLHLKGLRMEKYHLFLKACFTRTN